MRSSFRQLAAGCRGGRVGRKNDACFARAARVAGDTPKAFASGQPAATPAFTIVEIMVVMAIILVLASLVLATSSYVHNKGARSRAEAEIAAMSAALENYKADNGVYPSDTSVNAQTQGDPTQYQAASLNLYVALSGDTDLNRQTDPGKTAYMTFKDNQLRPATGNVAFIKDPFGNSYGYSTVGQAGTSGVGYNPTFDLWSTAGSTTSFAGWVKNW